MDFLSRDFPPTHLKGLLIILYSLSYEDGVLSFSLQEGEALNVPDRDNLAQVYRDVNR